MVSYLRITLIFSDCKILSFCFEMLFHFIFLNFALYLYVPVKIYTFQFDFKSNVRNTLHNCHESTLLSTNMWKVHNIWHLK